MSGDLETTGRTRDGYVVGATEAKTKDVGKQTQVIFEVYHKNISYMVDLCCTAKLIAKNEISTRYIIRFDCNNGKCTYMYMLFNVNCERTHSYM